MILIVGGAASGKRTYARTLGHDPSDMADAVLDERPVLYNLQDLAARDPANVEALLPVLLEKACVLCNEVGSGIIPTRAEDRAAREAAGRLCILLAQRAERVVRMLAGVPTVIKP